MSFISIAREFLIAVSQELDPYTTDKSKINVKDFKTISLETVKHIQFAKYGRGPGKQPPVNDLIQYVKEKGIIFDNTDAEGTAWAIAKSISKKGTKNWVPNAPNAIEEAINKNIVDYYKKINNFILDTQYEELQQLYEDDIPRKITLKL